MYPDAKKLLKEPLLWVGAIALCIPILASGQLGKMKDRLSFDHGGPVAQPVSIAEAPGSTSKTPVTPAIKIAPARIGSQRSREPSPTRVTPATTQPESTQPEPEVAISPLPQTDDRSDPGSLLDAAKMLGYENTQEPELSEPRYTEPEITNSQDGESLELSFSDEPESPISREPEPKLRFSEPSRNSHEQLAEALSSLESTTRSDGQQEISLAIDQQPRSMPTVDATPSPELKLPAMESAATVSQSTVSQSTESQSTDSQSIDSQSMESSESNLGLSLIDSRYRTSSTLPPTPMKFQAALRPPTSYGYSQTQRSFEPRVSTNFQAAMPTAPQAYSQQPGFSVPVQSVQHPLPQAIQLRRQGRGNAIQGRGNAIQGRGNAIGIWDQ